MGSSFISSQAVFLAALVLVTDVELLFRTADQTQDLGQYKLADCDHYLYAFTSLTEIVQDVFDFQLGRLGVESVLNFTRLFLSKHSVVFGAMVPLRRVTFSDASAKKKWS